MRPIKSPTAYPNTASPGPPRRAVPPPTPHFPSRRAAVLFSGRASAARRGSPPRSTSVPPPDGVPGPRERPGEAGRRDITLPEMTCARATMEEKALIQSTLKFEDFWKTSCYHLEEDVPKKKNDDKEIERYSDRKRKTHSKREALASYLILTPANFPVELVQGSKRGQPSSKKLRWDRSSGLFHKE
ncbi:hypothetical protein OsI_26837 [Oryza sativa Indica Group]|uniref:Uncharacterized protein n=1 Tax=Oryza sativa subsp. indica TaxID=39946 RepID=B8B8D8_ORYSI|nr:hypothetical protein OsI_26837 [Oryza sativa Indica Group]